MYPTRGSNHCLCLLYRDMRSGFFSDVERSPLTALRFHTNISADKRFKFWDEYDHRSIII